MISKAIRLIAALAICSAQAIEARPLRGGAALPTPPASAPILNNVTVNYGQYTANGMGGARLSSQDDATTYAVPVYGLGLMSPSGTACANWTTTQISGTSTHFTKYTGAEGTSARTPTITSTGDSANLNAGPYVFNVSCTDAGGNASNTATLTYTIVANAANVDDYSGNFPAVTSGSGTFANTSGYKLLLSTGFKKLTPATWGIVCPTECNLEWADPTKPGLFQSFNPNANQLTKLRVKDITFTGDATQNVMNFALPGNAGTTLALENVGCRFKAQAATSNPINCLVTYWPGAPGNNITNFYVDWIGLGMRIGGNGYNLRNVVIKNFGINAMDVNVVNDLTMYDWLFYNPQVAVGGYHADCFQMTNGATAKNWDLRRGGCVTAGGYGPVQGPIFPGHSTRAKGYIDNGSGGAGLNITLVAPVSDPNIFFDEGANRSQIFAPGCITAAENATIASSNGYDQAVLTGITARTCGSAVSPVDIYAYSMENVNARGIFHTGYGFSGWGQNSAHGTGGIQNFAYVHQTPQPTYATSAQISITGNTMTTLGATTSNATDVNATYNSGINWGSAEPYVISYPGLTGGYLAATGKTSNGTTSNCNTPTDTTCIYTLNRSPGNVTNVTATFVPPVGGTTASQSPQISFGNTAIPALYSGSGQTIKDGFVSPGLLFPLGGGSYGSPPSNMTVTNVWNSTTAPPSANFANGDPETAFQGISVATWNAMTPAQVLATHCHYLLGKAGGLLDNGDGTWASPFKPDSNANGMAEWYDGTDVPGCN